MPRPAAVARNLTALIVDPFGTVKHDADMQRVPQKVR